MSEKKNIVTYPSHRKKLIIIIHTYRKKLKLNTFCSLISYDTFFLLDLKKKKMYDSYFFFILISRAYGRILFVCPLTRSSRISMRFIVIAGDR